MIKRFEVLGTGASLPALRVSSRQLDQEKGLAPGTIEERTGVSSRYYAVDESASDLAFAAIQQALDKASLSLKDIDCLIAASGTMEQAIPCNAAKILARLQQNMPLNPSIVGFDINMTCLSALMAMDVAASLLAAGQYKRILIVSSEIASVGLDWQHIEIGGLFGDGAAALVVAQSPEETCGIHKALFRTYSEGVDLCQIQGGGSLHHPSKIKGDYSPYGMFQMQGKELYRLTRKVIKAFCKELLHNKTASTEAIDWVILHQASGLALQHFQKLLQFDPNKTIQLLQDHGNQVAVSLPFGLHTLLTTKPVRQGDRVLLLGTSAGLSIGGLVLQL
ncbi:MAG: 3-oxoacyl-[acyl-carrier-protein] synthase III C-terminal domain-containing protein [Candidatus Electrothrix scaldis]|nr:MAG: 3-oxoacyl-[acyl-carrier-protein] synthase III C-terminal domain-containing protein [Candidatus Electrothrix sp. GW3-3]